MLRTRAVVGSLVFFCAAPGVVAGLGPWWISDWEVETPFAFYQPVRVLGALMLVAAVAFLLQSFVRFVVEGLGTPAPVAPTEHLVIGGPYRFVRNPMYVAVVTAILGQALIFGQAALLWYGLAIALIQAAFVRFYEEPGLRRRYGSEYDTYRAAVPAWIPRLRPWKGASSPQM
ncbi:isoprenylcysteine carboxylmethyltransferase family protein [Micromonospora sp. NPDC005174]|uniref:methyltransferase family protein n=1 Tax=Micromonospora sp. NPDC005174 TaxID=3157018 RepID=UPI0033A382FF